MKYRQGGREGRGLTWNLGFVLFQAWIFMRRSYLKVAVWDHTLWEREEDLQCAVNMQREGSSSQPFDSLKWAVLFLPINPCCFFWTRIPQGFTHRVPKNAT